MAIVFRQECPKCRSDLLFTEEEVLRAVDTCVVCYARIIIPEAEYDKRANWRKRRVGGRFASWAEAVEAGASEIESLDELPPLLFPRIDDPLFSIFSRPMIRGRCPRCRTALRLEGKECSEPVDVCPACHASFMVPLGLALQIHGRRDPRDVKVARDYWKHSIQDEAQRLIAQAELWQLTQLKLTPKSEPTADLPQPTPQRNQDRNIGQSAVNTNLPNSGESNWSNRSMKCQTCGQRLVGYSGQRCPRCMTPISGSAVEEIPASDLYEEPLESECGDTDTEIQDSGNAQADKWRLEQELEYWKEQLLIEQKNRAKAEAEREAALAAERHQRTATSPDQFRSMETVGSGRQHRSPNAPGSGSMPFGGRVISGQPTGDHLLATPAERFRARILDGLIKFLTALCALGPLIFLILNASTPNPLPIAAILWAFVCPLIYLV